MFKNRSGAVTLYNGEKWVVNETERKTVRTEKLTNENVPTKMEETRSKINVIKRRR